MNVKSRVVLLFSRNTNCKHLTTSSKDNPEVEWTNGTANEMKLKGMVRNTVVLTVLFTVRQRNEMQYQNTLPSYRNPPKNPLIRRIFGAKPIFPP